MVTESVRESGPEVGQFVGWKAEPDLMIALASGLTNAEAAEQVGLSERTVRRRLADPDYLEQVSEIRSRIIDQATAGAVTRLAALLDEGLDELERLISGAKSESVRLGGIRLLLDHSLAYSERLEYEKRLRALEEGQPT